jgi:hypothetical protein
MGSTQQCSLISVEDYHHPNNYYINDNGYLYLYLESEQGGRKTFDEMCVAYILRGDSLIFENSRAGVFTGASADLFGDWEIKWHRYDCRFNIIDDIRTVSIRPDSLYIDYQEMRFCPGDSTFMDIDTSYILTITPDTLTMLYYSYHAAFCYQVANNKLYLHQVYTEAQLASMGLPMIFTKQ